MQTTSYWADNYVEKKSTALDAIRKIRSGQRVYIGSSCGEPQHLVRVLSEEASRFTDIEIVRLMSLETTPLTLIANKTMGQNMNIRSIYIGSAQPQAIARNKRFITPINLSAVPRLFKSRLMPINVALIQVTPPDDFGWMSLGISVDVTLAAAMSADLVIAQVNPRMPRVLGRSFIHVNDVDHVVEYEEDLITIGKIPEMETANTIGRLIARLIDDGSTLQIGPGTTPEATLLALSDKNDLGVHSQYITNDMMHLVPEALSPTARKAITKANWWPASPSAPKLCMNFCTTTPPSNFIHPIMSMIPVLLPVITRWLP